MVRLLGGGGVLLLAQVGKVEGEYRFGKLKLGIIKTRRQFEKNQNKKMSKTHDPGN